MFESLHSKLFLISQHSRLYNTLPGNMAREISNIFLALNLIVFCITAMPGHIENRLEQKRDGHVKITARDAFKYLADHLHMEAVQAVAGKLKKDEIEGVAEEIAGQDQEEDDDHDDNEAHAFDEGTEKIESPGCNIQ